jgi:hypothetical protein
MAITYASNTITISGAFSSGTATSGSTTTLTDTSKSWSNMAGRQVWIHTGAGAGIVAKIASNTATVLTFDRTLPTALNNTSQYIVGHAFYDIWVANNSGSWGVVDRDNNQFSLRAKIVVGDGTIANRAFLADTSKDIQFESGTIGAFVGAQYWNSSLIRWADYSGVAFGNVLNDANKTTHEGVTIRNLNTDTSFLMGGANANTAPTGNPVVMQLAGCQIIGVGSNVTTGRTIIATGDALGQSIMWNTSGMNGVELSPYNLDIYNSQISSAQFGAARFNGAVDKLTIASINTSNAPLYTHTVGEVSATFKNVFLRNNGYLFGIQTGCTLDCFLINPEYDNAGILYIGGTASTAKLWEQYELAISAKNKSDESALSGVRVYIEESTGTQVYNNTTDVSGEIPTQVLNRGYFTATSGQSRVLRTPHTLKLRKYGFTFQEQGFSATSKATLSQFFDVNPFTVASEATAATYSSKFTLNWTSRIITVTGNTTPQEMYDYTQYAAAQSGNIQYDELMTPISAGVFNMGDTRVVVANGGTLTVDTNPTVGALVFGDRTIGTNAIRVQSGGTLVTGTATTIGRVIDFKQDLTEDRQNYDNAYSSILTDAGSTWNWAGGQIQTHHSITQTGGGTISGSAEFLNLSGQTSPNGGQAGFRPDNASINILALKIVAGFFAEFTKPASLFGLDFEDCDLVTVGSRTANTYAEFYGANVSDPSNVIQYGHWDNRWGKFINHSTGSDFVSLGNLPDDSRNKGIGEVWQQITFSATSGSGAKFYTKDTNNGSRLAANQINSNPSYTSDRAYTLTESGGSASTTGDGVLTGVHWRSIGGLRDSNNRFDSRGINNDNSDIFNWLKVQYGYQPATLNVVMKGTSAVQSSIAQLIDLGVTQSNKTTVSGYTGITPVYSGGTLTVTVTSNHTWNEIYDYVKYWESENPASVWANSKSSFVSTSNKLTYTYNNLVVVVSGATLTMGSGQILSTQPTVVSNGKFISDSINLFYYNGELVKASRAYFQVKDSVTAENIEGVVIGFGDAVTQERLLFNASFELDTLVTDADGKADGYFVFEIGATVYGDTKQITGEYSYIFSTIPRSLNGIAIGSIAMPEVIRLTPDTQVVSSKEDAETIANRLSVDVLTDTINLNDETLSDAYDGLKWKVAANADIATGVPGCMYYCLFGLPISKVGTTFTGRTATTIYQNVGTGGTFGLATVAIEIDDIPVYTVGNLTFYFQDEGNYNWSTVDFIGAITLVNGSSGTVTVQMPSGSNYTNDPDVTVIQPQIYQSVTISGAIAGSRIQIYDLISNTELYQGTPTFPYTWTDGTPYAADREIRVRVMYVDGLTAKRFIEENWGTLTNMNPTVARSVTQTNDNVYITNAIDGSTVTDVVINDEGLLVEVSTGEITLQDIYAYETYWLSTADGIIDEGRFIEAIDEVNYKFYNFKIKNVSSPIAPLTITGGWAVDGATGVAIDLLDISGGAIFMAGEHVVAKIVTVAGGSVITGDITDVPASVWGANISSYTGNSAGKKLKDGLTVGKFLGLK